MRDAIMQQDSIMTLNQYRDERDGCCCSCHQKSVMFVLIQQAAVFIGPENSTTIGWK